jgi:hypothetical protein
MQGPEGLWDWPIAEGVWLCPISDEVLMNLWLDGWTFLEINNMFRQLEGRFGDVTAGLSVAKNLIEGLVGEHSYAMCLEVMSKIAGCHDHCIAYFSTSK